MINDLFCMLLFHVPEFSEPEPEGGWQLLNRETLINVNIHAKPI